MLLVSLFLKIQIEKTESGFPKTFYRGCLLVFIGYFCNHNPKERIKNFKNYVLIFAVVNYQNMLDISPPLICFFYD